MVKAKLPLSLGLALLLAAMAGCGKAPVRPLEGNSLQLSVARPNLTYSPQFTLALTLKYHVVSGSDVITGLVDLTQMQSINGPVHIPLPHGGRWLVSAEWINLGTTPLYIGADEVDVHGATPLVLAMGNLNIACYKISLADLGSTAGFFDLFTFDTHLSAPSTLSAGTEDVQCFFNNSTNPSLYLRPALVSAVPTFAYLGNGDWVDYTLIPLDTVFHSDTLVAKKAVAGLTAVMEAGDVYVQKLSPTTTAWIQVSQVVNTPPATSVDLYFRLNRHGYPYLKFDVTSYGDANCNTSGVTLYAP